jgi:hypothetical protein
VAWLGGGVDHKRDGGAVAPEDFRKCVAVADINVVVTVGCAQLFEQF